jgi:hypothetical protein
MLTREGLGPRSSTCMCRARVRLADRPGLLPSTSPTLRWNRTLSLTAQTARPYYRTISQAKLTNYRICRNSVASRETWSAADPVDNRANRPSPPLRG